MKNTKTHTQSNNNNDDNEKLLKIMSDKKHIPLEIFCFLLFSSVHSQKKNIQHKKAHIF